VILSLALMLQAAQAPQPHPAPVPESFRASDPAKAVETFKSTCWSHLRDEAALGEAAAIAPIAFRAQPHGTGPTHSWRALEGVLSYAADLPPGVPSPQCILRLHLAAQADQLALAARIAAALALPSGRTRTGLAVSETQWDVPTSDARTTRLIVTTRNTANGGSSLRFAAVLLAAAPASPQ